MTNRPAVLFGLLLTSPLLEPTSAEGQDPGQRPPMRRDAEARQEGDGEETACGPDAEGARTAGCSPLGRLPPEGSGKPWWDWVRKTNGETFGGTFLGMQDGQLHFRSDEAGELDLKWRNVGEFYSAQAVAVATVHGVQHVGPMEMIGEPVLVVHAHGGDVRVPRGDVLSINTAAGNELSKWYLRLTLGANLSDATIDQFTGNASLRIQRADGDTRLSLDYTLNYAVNDDPSRAEGEEQTVTTDNQTGTLKLDVFLSKRFFVTPAGSVVARDAQQNVRLRAAPFAGVGWHVFDSYPLDLDVSIAAAYQYTRFDSVEAGSTDGDTSQGGGALYMAYLDWVAIRSTLEFEVFHRGIVIYGTPDGFAQSSFRTGATVDVDITNVFSLDVSFTWDRVIDPPPREDGTPTQADTFTLVVGLALELGS